MRQAFNLVDLLCAELFGTNLTGMNCALIPSSWNKLHLAIIHTVVGLGSAIRYIPFILFQNSVAEKHVCVKHLIIFTFLFMWNLPLYQFGYPP